MTASATVRPTASSRRSPGGTSTSSAAAGASRKTVAKTGRARWIAVPPELLDAVARLCARDDRHADRRVFEGVTAFSPHDLRHRRISLLHLRGVPFARIGEAVGQRNLAVTANTYSHVLMDEREIDSEEVLT